MAFIPSDRTQKAIQTEIDNLEADILAVQTRQLQPGLNASETAALALQLSQLQLTLTEVRTLLIIEEP